MCTYLDCTCCTDAILLIKILKAWRVFGLSFFRTVPSENSVRAFEKNKKHITALLKIKKYKKYYIISSESLKDLSEAGRYYYV